MTDQISTFKKIALFDVFPFLCRLIGVALLVCVAVTLGPPPHHDIPPAVWIEGVAACFFLLLPSAQKISIGKLLTFEREVQQIKEEAKETRETMTSFLTVYSGMIATISNTVRQTVNLTFNPGRDEREKAQEGIKEVETKAPTQDTGDDVDIFVAGSGGDYNFALARIRMEMERALREHLGRRTVTSDPVQMRSDFMSAAQLFRDFIAKNPQLDSLTKPFQYVLKICNAAIHGQTVDENFAREAIGMGLTITQQIKNATQF